MKTDVYNMENKVVGACELPERFFGAAWKPALVHQVLTAQLANRREPWAHAKDRGEVRGGGRKPWRQKGTGRARHGSIRSPLWRGGGKSHGPVSTRDYAVSVNARMKQAALRSLLSKKFREKELAVLDSFGVEVPKTKKLAAALRTLIALPKEKKRFSVLLVPKTKHAALSHAAQNLAGTKVADPRTLNVYDLLRYRRLFIEEKAIPVIVAHYKK
ncbi:MAG: 50S ribosomal protein L4 [Candidatus Liptonbacteria bacterium]|nr:50S ribosomal protein L4 [Candidatus Liptonbacteria bacterium]